VACCEQTDQNAIDDALLPDDDFANLVPDLIQSCDRGVKGRFRCHN
jgi:hypothetical protein